MIQELCCSLEVRSSSGGSKKVTRGHPTEQWRPGTEDLCGDLGVQATWMAFFSVKCEEFV